MTSPSAKAYDPTEGMTADEKVRYLTREAKWRMEMNEDNNPSGRDIEGAREALGNLRLAMYESREIDIEAVTTAQELRAYIQRYEDTQPVLKKGPVDGDGDGFVYDGTPKKRPATPAEMAAGRALRAKKQAAGKKAAPAAKKAAAGKKTPYQQRVDKFSRAIDQAVKSGDKKQIKNVEQLIQGDLILRAPEKKSLMAALAARRDGKAAPVKAPAAKKVAAPPAKKAAAKVPAKAPAKKVAAPKPESKTDRNGVRVGRKTADSLDRMDAADKKMAENRAAVAAAKTPSGGKKSILERIADFGSRKAGVPKPSPQKGLQERLAAAAAERRQQSFERRTTTHGPKTRAWKRLVQRDIGNARTKNDLISAQKQIAALNRNGRISDKEMEALLDVVDARFKALGLDGKTVRPPSKIAGASQFKRVSTDFGNLPTPKTDSRDPLKMANEAAGFKKQIEAAKTENDLKAVQRDIAGPNHKNLREWLVMEAPQAKKVLDDAFASAKRRIRGTSGPARPAAKKPSTVVPKLPPGEARRKAMGNLPSDWADRVAAANNPSEVEQLMDALEQDKAIPDDEFNKIAEALDKQMAQIEDDANAFGQAGVEFEEPLDKGVRDRLDRHFAGKKATIASAPAPGLYHYLLVNPERFEVKRQTDNKGISGIDIITDKVTGDRWFAKHSAFSNDYGKEMLAGDILNMAGLSKHKVRVSKVGDYSRTDGDMRNKAQYVLLSQDAIMGNSLDGELKTASKLGHDTIAKEDVDKGLKEGDPQGLIDMAVFDYLIDNTADRHSSNAFFSKKGTRLKVMFIDHGLAFGSRGNNMDTRVGYKDWFAMQYRAHGNKGGWDISRLIGESVKGRADVEKRVADALAKFDDVDFAVLRQRYDDAVAGDAQAQRHTDEMFNMLEIRLERMRANADQIANVLIDAGGVL